MDFRFTRHILSCNNIYAGKSLGKDYEPGLSILGIIETVMFAQKNKDKFNSYDVCVSNLYRTWCTAFILYGTNLNQEDILNIWICPYLKEKVTDLMVTTLTRGNFPEEIQHMASKFLIFLELLHEIKQNEDLINKLKDVNSIKEFMNNKYNKWYDGLPKEIILRFPIKNDKTKHSNYMEVFNNIIYKKDSQGKYMILKNCVNHDLISNNPETNKEEWLQNGNLGKFMDWYNDDPMFKTKTIHAVTHSGILRKYLKSLGIIVKSKEEKNNETEHLELTAIGETNCWTFVTNAEVRCLNNIYGNTKKDVIKNLYDELVKIKENETHTIEPEPNVEEDTKNEIETETNNIMNKLNKEVDNTTDIKPIIKSVVSEKYGFEIKDKKLKDIKPYVKLLLLMVSLEKGVPENKKSKPIENFFKKKNKSLCSYSGSVKKTSRKTPIQCSKGMNGGTRHKKRRKTRKKRIG